MASVTVFKAKRIIQTAGPLELVRRGYRQFTGILAALVAIRRARNRQFHSLDELLDWIGRLGGGVIAPFQVRSEILGLLRRVKQLRPRVVVEIGTANGGTLFLFARVAAPDARLVSLDLPTG